MGTLLALPEVEAAGWSLPRDGARAFLRRLWRRARRCAHPSSAMVVYHPDYEVGIPGVPLDAGRGEKILRFLFDEHLLRPEALLRARPASLEALLRVHDHAYLETIVHEHALTRVLGFRLAEREAQRVVDVQRLMTGGTMLAARVAWRSGGVVVNLGGGFHHAGRASGSGFCLFNDVAVAVAELRQRGFDGRVLVVDLDVHDGNGTREIFAGDPRVHTYSIHNEHWGPAEDPGATTLALGPAVTDDRYLATLHGTLPSLVARFQPDLAVYLAGVDAAQGDTLGNWQVSSRGLVARDRFVLEQLRGGPRRIPTAVVLAGGYGQEAWRHSARLLAYLLTGQELEPPGSDEIVLSRYRHISHRLRAAEFSGEDLDRPFELTEEDLVGAGPAPSFVAGNRFLGALGRHETELLLERFGLLARLRDRGFDDLAVTVEGGEAGQTLRITQAGRPPQLLVELRVRRSASTLPGHEVAVIEWLLLQNPRLRFASQGERLPGQQHPGLGLLRDVLGWLSVVCERLGLAALVFTPSHYHSAVRSRSLLRCVEPRDEARLRALKVALAGLSLAQASQALDEGRVRRHGTGEVVRYEPALIALPVSEALRQVLFGAEYEAAVEAARAEFDLELSPVASPAAAGPA